MVARFLDPNAPDPLHVYVVTFEVGDFGSDTEVFADYDRAVDAIVQSISPDEYDEEDEAAILALKDIKDASARLSAAQEICNSDKRAEQGYRATLDEREVIGMAERPTQELHRTNPRDHDAIAHLLHHFVGYLNGLGYSIVDSERVTPEAKLAPPNVEDLCVYYFDNPDGLGTEFDPSWEAGLAEGKATRKSWSAEKDDDGV